MIELTQDLLRQIFIYDEGNIAQPFIWQSDRKFSGLRAGFVGRGKMRNGTDNSYYRIAIEELHRQFRLHRLVFLYHHGWLPKQVDHINRDKTDNRIDNLRPATNSQNCANKGRQKNNTSKYKGVYYSNYHNRWCAKIRFQGKDFHIKMTKDKDQAAIAYNQKATELFGDFAYQNQVPPVL
jgi:hypothetical protein